MAKVTDEIAWFVSKITRDCQFVPFNPLCGQVLSPPQDLRDSSCAWSSAPLARPPEKLRFGGKVGSWRSRLEDHLEESLVGRLDQRVCLVEIDGDVSFSFCPCKVQAVAFWLENIVGKIEHSPTTEGLAKSVLYVGEVTLEPGPKAEKETPAVKDQSLCSCVMKKKSKITCLVKNVSKLTCVVKVKLNVVNARLCDAWWLGRRGSWQDKIMKGDE